MAKLLKLRRGTDTQHTTFTGAEGEVTVNTTNDSLHVHDGTTAGGTELARADLSNAAGASIPGTLTVNQLVVDDDGSGSPVVRISGDDAQPWGLVVNNSTFTTNTNDGWRVHQADAGDIYMDLGGDGAYENFYLRSSDGAGGGATENCLHIDTNRAVHLKYQNGTKLSTTSTGIDVTGTVSCDSFSSPTAVTAGSYGSASAIPNFTVDSSGRLTAAGSSALNNASETVSGIVELATAAETTTGTATNRAVHPAGLKVELDKKLDSDISSLPTLP